jgi:hypothetical protein
MHNSTINFKSQIFQKIKTLKELKIPKFQNNIKIQKK